MVRSLAQEPKRKKESKFKKLAKYVGDEAKANTRVQEGSPVDYIQRGWSRFNKTKMVKKVKSKLDQNKK